MKAAKKIPRYKYTACYYTGPGCYPTEEEAAMNCPPKDECCIVKLVCMFHTSYYEVVGCKSAMLIHRHK